MAARETRIPANGVATLTVRRVVHASVLLDFGGARVLTDPWFSQLHGHYWGETLGVELADLPELAGVAVSHKDYDHYDMGAFAAYPHGKEVPFAVRRGTAGAAKEAGFRNVAELKPWESAYLGPVKVTAAPAKHKEEMGVEQNTYVFEANGFTVYFGGDTLLMPEHRELARRFPRIDVALLPINGLTIRPLGYRRVVMDAEEAAEMTAMLGPRVVVPIHYRYTSSLWRKALIKHERSPEGFVRAVNRRAQGTEVRVLTPGEPLDIGRQD